MENKFYIFGSKDSLDYDVLVQVDYIPKDIDKAHNICKHFNTQLSTLLKDKELNSNLAIIEMGKIIKVFKGTSDELNNVIFYTYNNHKQYYPNPITSPLRRDIDEKILRVARFILSFYSRTNLRKEIKNALKNDLKVKLEVLKKIDFVQMQDFSGKKEKKEDIYKVLAFQFGQVFSLIDGYEKDSYEKDGIIKNYSNLKNIIKRKELNNSDMEILNSYLYRFIKLIEKRINDINLTEKLK
jgi:hypothetical protein